MREQAYRLLTGGLAEAFDLGREDPRLVARYDTAPWSVPTRSARSGRTTRTMPTTPNPWASYCCWPDASARRGCGFVTVTTNFVWDMHADENNATMEEGMRYMGLPLDHALSAFLEDLHARGLDEKILLVACGEMGRSPPGQRQRGAAITGATSAPCCWPAAASPWAKSSASPIATARPPTPPPPPPPPPRRNP